jgi:hypothetical protein
LIRNEATPYLKDLCLLFVEYCSKKILFVFGHMSHLSSTYQEQALGSHGQSKRKRFIQEKERKYFLNNFFDILSYLLY